MNIAFLEFIDLDKGKHMVRMEEINAVSDVKNDLGEFTTIWFKSGVACRVSRGEGESVRENIKKLLLLVKQE